MSGQLRPAPAATAGAEHFWLGSAPAGKCEDVPGVEAVGAGGVAGSREGVCFESGLCGRVNWVTGMFGWCLR